MKAMNYSFAYPFSVEPHVKVKTIVRQAQIQHEQYGRPPKVGRPEVIHVTQKFINDLRAREEVEPGSDICDLCQSDTPAVTKFEAPRLRNAIRGALARRVDGMSLLLQVSRIA
jgi:hypothetical protein